jgi:hypothetical protein
MHGMQLQIEELTVNFMLRWRMKMELEAIVRFWSIVILLSNLGAELHHTILFLKVDLGGVAIESVLDISLVDIIFCEIISVSHWIGFWITAQVDR